MSEAGIGRILVASLHQGIADLLPSRLEFYENWFNPTGLRNGTIGLAPLLAVLSFLRREGDAYGLVTERAGELAAEWTFDQMSGRRRWALRRLPAACRVSAALKMVRRIIHDSYGGSRAVSRVRRGAGSVEIRGSVFCGVRERWPASLCGFYAAAVSRAFLLFGLQAQARVTECRAVGNAVCVIAVAVHGGRLAPSEAHLLRSE
jgi:hypothetical protein